MKHLSAIRDYCIVIRGVGEGYGKERKKLNCKLKLKDCG